MLLHHPTEDETDHLRSESVGRRVVRERQQLSESLFGTQEFHGEPLQDSGGIRLIGTGPGGVGSGGHIHEASF